MLKTVKFTFQGWSYKEFQKIDYHPFLAQ